MSAHPDSKPFITPIQERPVSIDITDARTQEGTTDVDPHSSEFELKKGKALIISNNFYGTVWQRKGNEIDKASIKEILESIGYNVTVLEDTWDERRNCVKQVLQKETIMETLDNWSQNKNGILDGADSIVVVILTHGTITDNDECICTVFNDDIPIKYIHERFANNRCGALLGKPKIFLQQFCRGGRQDHGSKAKGKRSVAQADSCPEMSIANMAEFFIASASYHEYEAYLTEKGSWFIQAVVEVFKKRIPENWELHQMMLEVNRNVAQKVGNGSTLDSKGNMNLIKEASCFSSSLTKEVYFTNK